MPFITKLDFGNDRQARQEQKTIQHLYGGTSFGTTFSALTTGPDLSTTGITSNIAGISSTFTGTTGSTTYFWYDSRMSLGEAGLSAITPSNSGITQNTGPYFAASSFITIDGNTVAIAYTGLSFDIVCTGMTDLGGGNYSGNIITNVVWFYSASSIDFTGRTIWVDVSGKTRTEELIVTKNPVIGYVLTCIDTEGGAAWMVGGTGSTGTTGTTYWSASSGTNAIVVNYSDSLASGILALAEGSGTTASGNQSHAEGCGSKAISDASHAEGSGTTASGLYSHAEGLANTSSGTASHSEGGFLGTFGQIPNKSTGDSSHAEGGNTTASGGGSHTEGYGTIASANYSHAEGSSTTASGVGSHSEGIITTAIGQYSHAGGSGTTASGVTSFVHGNNSTAGGNSTIVLGDNITGTTNDTVYVSSLNIKTVGAGPSVIDIGVDGNGLVVNTASDVRLKENIKTIDSALEKIKNIRGVYFDWKNKINGGDTRKIGFIAQEVEPIIPELVYTHNDGFKTVHYKDVTALLVEAVKTLSSGITISNKTHLETQTILAEDNNIELNYSGNQQTALGGGITVLHAKGQNLSAQIITDENGNWVTNNDFKANGLVIPIFTPTTSNDSSGNDGNITRDNNYLYLKTVDGWKRSNLESF